MTAFADACRVPFANGTEFDAWEATWCAYCSRDHGMTHHASCGDGCDLVLAAMLDEWPEGWIPQPDDGRFSLPSRMVCTAFVPCTTGDCSGDPGAVERAERVAEVTAYWRERGPQ